MTAKRILLALALLLFAHFAHAQTAAEAYTAAKHWATSEDHSTDAGYWCKNTARKSPGAMNQRYGIVSMVDRYKQAGSGAYDVVAYCDADGTVGPYPRVTTSAAFAFASGGCAAPKEMDDATLTCKDPAERCRNKMDSNGSDTSVFAGAAKCVDGCMYGPLPAKSGTSSSGGSTLSWGKIGFTGAVCPAGTPSDPTPPPKPKSVCNTPTGQNLTMCVRDDGKHCYLATTGTYICWGPNETGTKNADGITQKREGGPNKPATPPDTTDQNKPTTTNTTTPGGTTVINTTNNYNNNYGTNNPGTPDSGEPPEGNPDEGEGSDPGAPGAGMGAPYDAGDRTVADAVSDYKARIQQAPVINAASSFFAVNINGACPVWTVAATEFTPTLTLDVQCSAGFQSIFSAAGWIVLAIAAFCAFRIAFY